VEGAASSGLRLWLSSGTVSPTKTRLQTLPGKRETAPPGKRFPVSRAAGLAFLVAVALPLAERYG
jgi:hypothetical protein